MSRIAALCVAQLRDVMQVCVAAAQIGAYSRATMALPPPLEVARRVRAAFAYADCDTTKEHPELGISRATVARIVSTSKPRGANHEELERIAGFTNVPLGFLTDGWPDESPSTPERLEALEHQYATLKAQLAVEGEARAALADAVNVLQPVIAQHTREIAALAAGRRRGGPGEGTQR
jgi:transcriptional regulator with XRE-family HTH domain